ncbi:hypothetical protein FHS89_001625 [Rubricella aquisinus]|uniref:Uncharacterized protein n=1 Tax=Rubricella aquisinus TaxID=2028108 RepID=A0A840WNE3_9RHOB|nr:hypothetical protein [Rubricella aquisinus]MBB5515613.1 hypothetical protein [Rubricella aquisinus]
MLAFQKVTTLPHRPESDPVLERLRRVMRRSRAQRRLDLFTACTLLSSDRSVAFDAYAQALLRTLGREVGQPLVLFHPGTAERSFDEDWILRCLERIRAGDGASVMFLISRRVPKFSRRQVMFLLNGLAERADVLHVEGHASHRQHVQTI